jgi:hypothetical protein
VLPCGLAMTIELLYHNSNEIPFPPTADKPSEHLSNLFLKGLKGIVEPITSAAGGSGSQVSLCSR